MHNHLLLEPKGSFKRPPSAFDLLQFLRFHQNCPVYCSKLCAFLKIYYRFGLSLSVRILLIIRGQKIQPILAANRRLPRTARRVRSKPVFNWSTTFNSLFQFGSLKTRNYSPPQIFKSKMNFKNGINFIQKCSQILRISRDFFLHCSPKLDSLMIVYVHFDLHFELFKNAWLSLYRIVRANIDYASLIIVVSFPTDIFEDF